MTFNEYWGFLVGSIFFAVICLFAFAYYLKIARLIQDTPTSKIRSAAQGFVELEGISHDAGKAILSPLSQASCIWYRFKIEKKVKSGKDSHWRTVQSGQSPSPIILDDNTGQCVLQLKGAKIIPEYCKTWYGNSPYPSALSIQRKDSFLQVGNYRYTEELIAPQSPLYALGFFKTFRAIDQHDKEAAIKHIISQWKSDYQSLLKRFDRNGDGSIDMQEWKLVRLAAELESQDLEQNLVTSPEIHTMQKQASLPYIISSKEQHSISGRYIWFSRGLFLLFIGLCYISLKISQNPIITQ